MVTDNGELTETTQKSVTVTSPALVLSLTTPKDVGHWPERVLSSGEF